MPLLKIDLNLDADQLKREGVDVTGIAGKADVAFGNLTTRVAGFSVAFNQVSDVVQKVSDIIAVPIQEFSQLQSAMANVASLGVDEIPLLTDSILDMADEIAVPIDNLSSGLYEVVSAGVDAASQIQVLELSAKASKAGIAQTSEAIRLSSAVIKGYGEDWSFVDDVLDDAFQTVKLGQTTFPELANTVGQVVPTFGALKISSDELFGSFATLTGVTGNTSEVSTQLKAVATELAKPTKNLSSLIKEQTGLSVEQATAQKGLKGVLDILAKATDGSAAKMGELFGSVEAINALLALTTTQYNTFIDKTDQMRNSTGAMTEAFDIQNSTMDAQLQILNNRWKRAMIGAAEVVVPFTNNVIDFALKIFDASSAAEKLTDSIKDVKSQMSQVSDINALILTYETLTSKTNLNEQEHNELKSVISELSELYPTAITRIDDYGVAVEINTGKVKGLVAQQMALLRAQEGKITMESLNQLRDAIDTIVSRDEKLESFDRKITELREGTLRSFTHFSKMQSDIAIEVTEAAKEAFIEDVEQMSFSIDKELIPLLRNFFDFDTDRNELARKMGLTGQQVDFLIERWDKLVEVQKEAEEKGRLAVKKEVELIAKPGSPERPQTDFATFDVELNFPKEADLEAIFRDQLMLLDTFYAESRVLDDEYHQRRIGILDEQRRHFEMTKGIESAEALRTRQDIARIDKEYFRNREEMEKQSLSTTAEQLNNMFVVFQGTSETMFMVGKAAAIAGTYIDTYQSATAAYKAMVGIPVIGPVLATAAAAAAIVSGLANVQRIQATNFEKKREGGLLGDSIRSILEDSFGQGEDRLFIGNSDEFLVNRGGTLRNLELLKDINSGARFVPVGEPKFSATGSDTNLKSEFNQFRNDVVRAIKGVNIRIESVMDGQQFLRRNFHTYEILEKANRF